MIQFQTKLLSSLVKVFPKEEPCSTVKNHAGALRGEVFSFQVAYRTNAHRIPVAVEAESVLKRYITLRSVENVPVEWMPDAIDEDVVGTAPGMYPDILRELNNGKLNSVWDHWRSIWVTVRIPKSCKSGKYDIRISFRYFDKDPEVNKEFCYSETLSLEVLDAVLPPQQLKNTHWFHTDCLSNYYNAEVFSEEYWKIVGAFMKNAADHGINMILTPLFTPPLDTAPGGERKTVQLVKVKKDRKGYSFDFSLLGKWFLLAEKSGIKADFSCPVPYLPVIHKEEDFEKVKNIVENEMGKDAFHTLGSHVMSSEDFSFYLQDHPGIFAHLGSGDSAALHSSGFDFDDKLLVAGIRYFCTLALELFA